MRFMPYLLATFVVVFHFVTPIAYAQNDVTAGANNSSDAMNRYFAQSERSKQVGEAYFNAYLKKNWDELGTLLADQGNFTDPTARLVFGNVDVTGKAEVLRYFRENYAKITMKFLPARKVYSGHYAIFEGSLDWTYPGENGTVRVVMPFTNILHIENGLVVKHTDLADYHPYFGTDQ